MLRRSYQTILFDLDGTLTDSGPGIMNGFAYAIRKMGGQVPEREELRKFVGPTLAVSFREILGYSPEETDRAIRLYREYYDHLGGVYENTVYPGVGLLLSGLKASGRKLILATSKSARPTDTVLGHFGLRPYFDFVAAGDDQLRPHKIDVIRHVIAQCGITDLTQAVMIGDRESDISAAAEAGIDSIGVLYGYGSREELLSAGATFLAAGVLDLCRILG